MVSPQHNISDRLKSFSSKHSVCVECGAENPAFLYVLGNAVIDLAACVCFKIANYCFTNSINTHYINLML